MILVIDNFFDANSLQLVTNEIKKLQFYSCENHPCDGYKDVPEYQTKFPGTRTDIIERANPLLNSFIYNCIKDTGKSFLNHRFTLEQFAHLRTEDDNEADYIHQDPVDWAYLIYLSDTNLTSGTKMYSTIDSKKDAENTFIHFVQNRVVMFDSSTPHMAWNNHGQNMDNGRLTINGFCKYIYPKEF